MNCVESRRCSYFSFEASWVDTVIITRAQLVVALVVVVVAVVALTVGFLELTENVKLLTANSVYVQCTTDSKCQFTCLKYFVAPSLKLLHLLKYCRTESYDGLVRVSQQTPVNIKNIINMIYFKE